MPCIDLALYTKWCSGKSHTEHFVYE